MAAKYDIQVDKAGAQITATFDVKIADIGSTELLASFELIVAGKNLIDKFIPQKQFSGKKFHTLTDPSADAVVSFGISTNTGWKDGDSKSLRGERHYDDVHFA